MTKEVQADIERLLSKGYIVAVGTILGENEYVAMTSTNRAHRRHWHLDTVSLILKPKQTA